MDIYLKNALIIAGMILVYELQSWIARDFDNFDAWMFIRWYIIQILLWFIPMYGVLILTLKILKSKALFAIVSWVIWASYPILITLNNHSESDLTFNTQGGTVYLDGELTLFGYLYKLENPFFLLALYATVILIFSYYKKFQSKDKEQ